MTRSRLALLGVCLLAALVYINSLPNGFALDDQHIIKDNSQVYGIEALPEAITGAYWPSGPPELGMYRPLTLATYAVDWELWDGEPFGFHLVNVLLHAAVTALVFLLIAGLGGSVVASAAGSAAFAVHPVHVEAVANVVGRAEILAALFFLAACIVYLRPRKGWGSAALIGLLYLLSLLSKEIGVTLPGALVLLHAAERGTLRDVWAAARERWRVYVGLAGALVAYFSLRWVNIGALAGGGDAAWFCGMPPGTRFWTAVRVIPEYLRLMLVPLDLVSDYGPAVIVPEPSWASPLVLLGILTFLALVAATITAWKRARLVSIGILWFAGTVLPVSGLLLTTQVLLAERTLYLPSVGFAVVVAGIVVLVQRHRPERLRVAAAILALLVIAGGVRTWAQNPVWRDTNTVTRHLIETHPANYRALWLMGMHLKAQGQPEPALQHLRLALRMAPGHYALRRDYAGELFAREDYDAAAAQFDTARAVQPSTATAHVEYLNSLLRAGRAAEVAGAAGPVASRFPDNMAVHHLSAQALTRLERWQEARASRERALRLDEGPARWAHWLNLAALETVLGNSRPAASALDSARAQAPDPERVPTPAGLEDRLESGNTAGIPFW